MEEKNAELDSSNDDSDSIFKDLPDIEIDSKKPNLADSLYESMMETQISEREITEEVEEEAKEEPQKGPEKEKRKMENPRNNDQPYPDLPQEFRDKFRELGFEQEAVLVIQKALFESDVHRNNNRFSMPKRQIAPGLFTGVEDAIDVRLIDPFLGVTVKKLKKWNMKHTIQYVLTKNWYKDVVQGNENVLKAGRKVQLWMARNGSHLCFALVLLPEQEGKVVKEERRAVKEEQKKEEEEEKKKEEEEEEEEGEEEEEKEEGGGEEEEEEEKKSALLSWIRSFVLCSPIFKFTF